MKKTQKQSSHLSQSRVGDRACLQGTVLLFLGMYFKNLEYLYRCLKSTYIALILKNLY